MVKCSFSGRPIEKGTGKMYVKKDGKVLYFANSKAQKNFLKLKRKARTTRWTEEAKKAKEVAMHAAAPQKPKPATKKPAEK